MPNDFMPSAGQRAAMEYALQAEKEFLHGINNSTYTQVFTKPIIGGTMPAVGEKVSYGRLVRIPTGDPNVVGMRAYQDVTVADAKREVKRLRKLARQIEKACR